MADLHDFRDSFNVRGAPPSLDSSLDEHHETDIDTTGVYLPNPLRFGDEGFCAFAVKEGRIYRLRYDAASKDVTHYFDEFNAMPPAIYVSRLDNTTEYTDIISFDDGLVIEDDRGICVTNEYLYVNVIGIPSGGSRSQHLYQIRLADHKVRKITLQGNYRHADNFRGMIIDVDNKRKPYLVGNFANFTDVDGIRGWSTVRGSLIWELDERTLQLTKLTTLGGGNIRLATRILTDKSTPLSDRDESRLYHGEVGYVVNGVLWNSCVITRRHISTGVPPQTIKWAGLASWRWCDIAEYANDGSGFEQWVDMTISVAQFPENPQLDLLEDIGMETPIIFTNEYQRIWSLCVDDQEVGWVSYFRDNTEAPDNDTNLPFNSDRNMFTHLFRYNLAETRMALTEAEVAEDIEPVVPLDFVWSQPTGYSFNYQISETPPTSNITIGNVSCRVDTVLDGVYKILSQGIRYTGIAPYQINAATGQIYVQPLAYQLLTQGSDFLRVAYELSDGHRSTIDVEVVVYERATDLTPTTNVAATPIFFNTPYTATLTEGYGGTRAVAYIAALRATYYRLHSSVSTSDWSITRETGVLRWIGSSATGTYRITVEAVNEGLSGQTEAVASTVVVVRTIPASSPTAPPTSPSSPTPEIPYTSPSLNLFWHPIIGWHAIRFGWLSWRKFGDHGDRDFGHTYSLIGRIDMTNAAIEGSESKTNWIWRIQDYNEAVTNVAAIYNEHSAKFGFVGLTGSVGETFYVYIHDGIRETRMIELLYTTVHIGAPENNSFVYFYQGASSTATTSVDVSIQENSPVREIFTAASERLYVLATPQDGYRDVTVAVEKGSDKISVALGDIEDRSIGGTINKVRRLHVYTSGAVLDYETDTSEEAVVSATAMLHTSDGSVDWTAEGVTAYKAAQQKLTFNITVTDNASEGTREKYLAPYAHFGWDPGDDWTRTQATTWSKDEETGAGGAFEIDVMDAIIMGTNRNLTWTIDSSDESVGQAVVYQGRLVFRGLSDGDVTFTLSVSDRVVTTVVANLDVSYSAPVSEFDSTVVFYRDGAELSEIDFEIVDLDAEEQLDGSEVYVSVEEIENRTLEVESSVPSVVRVGLSDEVEEITVSGATKKVKELEIYHNALVQRQGDVDGTITAEVYQSQIGSTIYGADSAELTIDGEVDYYTFDAEIELWRKHRTTETSEQITAIEVLVLKGTDDGNSNFPVHDGENLGDYDYYYLVNGENINVRLLFDTGVISARTTYIGTLELGGENRHDLQKIDFTFDVDNGPNTFTTPNMTPKTGVLTTYIGTYGVTDQNTPIDENDIGTNTGQVLVNRDQLNFTISGEVQVLANIKLYNGNVRTQQTTLVMADATAFSGDQIFPEIGGDTYVTHFEIPNTGGPLEVEFLRDIPELSISRSHNTTQVQVLAEGGGTETLRMKTLKIHVGRYSFPGTYSGTVRIYTDERVVSGTTHRAGELLIPISGEITETYEAPTLDTTFLPAANCSIGGVWTRTGDTLSVEYTDLEQTRFSWIAADFDDFFTEGSRPAYVMTNRMVYNDTTRYIGVWYQEEYSFACFVPVAGDDDLDDIEGSINLVVNDRQTSLTQPLSITSSQVPAESRDRIIGLRQSASATEVNTISNVTVGIDRQLHKDEILTGETEQLYIHAEDPNPHAGRPIDLEVIVAEGSQFITARIGEATTKTNDGVEEDVWRLHLYASGAVMPATQCSAKIIVAMLHHTAFHPKLLTFDVTINPSGNKADEDEYRAHYFNPAYHPCTFKYATSGTVVDVHSTEGGFGLRRFNRGWRMTMNVGGDNDLQSHHNPIFELFDFDDAANFLAYTGTGGVYLDVETSTVDSYTEPITVVDGPTIQATATTDGLNLTIPSESCTARYVITLRDYDGSFPVVAADLRIRWIIEDDAVYNGEDD